jgi:CRP-like cAMP-binding protein
MTKLKDLGISLENHLLASLTCDEYRRLSRYLESTRLTKGKILYNVGDHVHYAYFPKGGMISLLSTTEDGKSLEVSMVGNEGMVGIPIILKTGLAPYQIKVQIAGSAVRIRGDVLRDEFDRGGRLQELLLRYANASIIQIAQSAVCSRFHKVEERLCRCLLLSRDRVNTDTIHLTQELLSYMLGIPRTSVTTIAVALQKEGLIKYSRGKIMIVNRQGLENGSCECYQVVNKELRHYLAA